MQKQTFQHHFLYSQEQEQAPVNDLMHEIVVFVHGTIIGIPSFILKDTSFRFQSPYIYQPIDGLGLKEISPTSSKNIGSLLAAHNYQRLHTSIHGSNRKIHFFTYGWNGFLSAESRKHAGEELYLALIHKRDEIQKETSLPIDITLQGHSHGGNVIAYLKDFELIHKKKLRINKVGLRGTPIQEETATNWGSPVFNRIYHCYSKKDRVMTLDILSTKRHRSYRRFDKIYKIPDKISQVELRVHNMHPTHAELWFLGCINRFLYRKEFGLYPFPCIHLAPAIFHAVDSVEKENKNIIININNRNHAYQLEVTPYSSMDTETTTSSQYIFQYNMIHGEPLQAFGHRFINLAA